MILTPFTHEVIARNRHSPRGIGPRFDAIGPYGAAGETEFAVAIATAAIEYWATSQIAQTTLRSLLGRADLDTLLAHGEDLNSDRRAIIDKQTEP